MAVQQKKRTEKAADGQARKLATQQKERADQAAGKRYFRGGSTVLLALQEDFARVSYPPFIPHREWEPWVRILRLLSTADQRQQFYESGTQSVFGQWALRVNAAIEYEDSVRIVGDLPPFPSPPVRQP